MSSTTTHLHLVKPAKNETADSDVINANMVAIDTAVYNLNHKPTTDAGKFLVVKSNGDVEPSPIVTENILAQYIKKDITVKVGDSENHGRVKNVTGVLDASIDTTISTFYDSITIDGDGNGYKDCAFTMPSGYNNEWWYGLEYVVLSDSDSYIRTVQIDRINQKVYIQIKGPSHQAYAQKDVMFIIRFYKPKFITS